MGNPNEYQEYLTGGRTSRACTPAISLVGFHFWRENRLHPQLVKNVNRKLPQRTKYILARSLPSTIELQETRA